MLPYLIAAVCFAAAAPIHGETVLVHPSGGAEFLLELSESANESDVRNAVEEVTGYSADQQRLLYRGEVLSNDDVEGASWIDVEISNLSNKGEQLRSSPTWRNYDCPVTESERADIEYIVTTIGDSSLLYLGANRAKIMKVKARIEHIHTLRFLGVAFSNDKMIVGMRNLRKRGGWVWSDFASETWQGLSDAMNDKDLEQHVPHFMNQLGLKPNLVQKCIKKKQWLKFFDTLIANVKRQGDPDDFDF